MSLKMHKCVIEQPNIQVCFPILDGQRGLRHGKQIHSGVATGAITLKYFKSSGTPLFKHQKEVNASPFWFIPDRNWQLSQCRLGIIYLALFLKGSKAANIWVWWFLCRVTTWQNRRSEKTDLPLSSKSQGRLQKVIPSPYLPKSSCSLKFHGTLLEKFYVCMWWWKYIHVQQQWHFS